MTLYELGQEYLAQEKVLRQRLKELRRLPGRKEGVLRRRIYYLTTEATACHKIGLYLIHYYGEENHGETTTA